MAKKRKKRKKGGPARTGGGPAAPGFRPGREPVALKRQRAKARLGSDAGWAQKQAVEAVAGRSPQEVRKMVARWRVGLWLGALVLGVLGALLYGWSVAAGVVVHVLTAGLAFLAYRVGKQGQGLAELAGSL